MGHSSSAPHEYHDTTQPRIPHNRAARYTYRYLNIVSYLQTGKRLPLMSDTHEHVGIPNVAVSQVSVRIGMHSKQCVVLLSARVMEHIYICLQRFLGIPWPSNPPKKGFHGSGRFIAMTGKSGQAKRVHGFNYH